MRFDYLENSLAQHIISIYSVAPHENQRVKEGVQDRRDRVGVGVFVVKLSVFMREVGWVFSGRQTHTENHSDDVDVLSDSVVAKLGDVVLVSDNVRVHVEVQKGDVLVLVSHVGVEDVDAVLDVLDHGCDGVGEVVADADTACLTFLCAC